MDQTGRRRCVICILLIVIPVTNAHISRQVPALIKKDMRSLTTVKGDTEQPLNLQQRVIQSGLDSLEGDDATDIVALFKGMAVFAEDQVVSVPVVSVLCTSLKLREASLSAITLRQWLSQLLSRSILLGSVSDGVAMHDSTSSNHYSHLPTNSHFNG